MRVRSDNSARSCTPAFDSRRPVAQVQESQWRACPSSGRVRWKGHAARSVDVPSSLEAVDDVFIPDCVWARFCHWAWVVRCPNQPKRPTGRTLARKATYTHAATELQFTSPEYRAIAMNCRIAKAM